MGISMQEVDRRLHMFDFTPSARNDLTSFCTTLKSALPEIIEEFYTRQLANKEIAAIISPPETLARLRVAMSNFITTLFAANYDETYINGRLLIGKVHKRLNITPKLYMSGISTLQNVLDRNIDALSSTDSKAQNIKAALHKAMLFDSELVFESYIDSYQEEMEQARAEVNHYAASLEIKVEALTRQLYEQSIHDALTGLYNRAAFNEHLERELKVAQRYQLPLCLAYLDLNGFKGVNDTYGHEAGDAVLQQVGASMFSITRSVDVACRYGGDEFCIIMPRCNLENAQAPLQRLMEHFDAACSHNVTFSIGVVQSGPSDFKDATILISEADTLMYTAKARAHEDPGHHLCTTEHLLDSTEHLRGTAS